MAPHLAEVERLRDEALALKDKLTALKRADADDAALKVCRERLLAAEKAARESQSAADTIDAATFDLKAVNPRARVEKDTRTPAEILDAIDEHGRSVESALRRLRALTKGTAVTGGLK